jgi:RNA polymerase sigma factor (TIGR02999 family)
MDESQSQITVYLKRLTNGDTAAEEPLAELVYAELQRLARRLLRGANRNVSLQTTALVNDVLIELVRLRTVDWQSRSHFYRVAARLLRRRLIDYIRKSHALKRPPSFAKISLEEMLLPSHDRFEEVLFVNECLDQLTEFDSDMAELVELVYFGGVPIHALAEMRNVSEKTIDRHLDLARRWMAVRLRTPTAPAQAKAAVSLDGQ